MLEPKPKFDFDIQDDDQWRQNVDRELKGKNYEDFLVWNSIDGFSIEAWQSRMPEILTTPPSRSEAWKIIEYIPEQDAQLANKAALDSLNAGAEGVWFQKSFLGAAANVASNGIDQSIAPVFINAGTCVDPFYELLKTGMNPSYDDCKHCILDGERLRSRGAGPIEEIGILIAQGIALGKAGGFNQSIIFKTASGGAYLTEIAKTRALRWLWSRILHLESATSNTKVLGTNLNIGYTKSDEHTNILRATSSCMSAVIGGSDYVMLKPWDATWNESADFSRRITRNIQVLLKDEGRLDKNLNMADGSYFIENLTTTIAQMAWKFTQEIEANGGFEEATKSNFIRNILEENRKRLISAYIEGSEVLLGANKFKPENKTIEDLPTLSTYEHLPALIHLPSEIQANAS